MTYLVTGATGFIGRKLVRALIERGDAVYYLARKRSANMPSQASFHPWDTAQKPDLNALSRIDGIFHLAGESVAQRWSSSAKKRIYDSRVDGTRNLVTAIGELQHRPKVLVSASAIGYYGDRGEELLRENAAPGSDFLSSLCQDWERAAFEARTFGVRTVALRIGLVLGRDGGALPRMLKPFRVGVGGRFGSGKQWVSWIHVDDLGRLLLFAADSPSLEGPVNAASPQPVTNAHFTNALAAAVHRPARLTVPGFALRLALGEMADVVLASQRVVPGAAEQSGFQFQYPELDSALASVV